jgi:hypothetical protein
MVKADRSVKKDNIVVDKEGNNVHLSYLPLPSPPHGMSGPSTPAHKHHRTFSDGAHRCRRRVVSGMVATNIGGPSSHAEAEEVSWKLANQTSLPKTVPCVSNDEDSLSPHQRSIYTSPLRWLVV